MFDVNLSDNHCMELNANVSGFRNAVFALVVEWAKHRTDRLTAAVERTERAAAKKAVQCILLPFLCVRSLVTVRSLLFGNAVGGAPRLFCCCRVPR